MCVLKVECNRSDLHRANTLFMQIQECDMTLRCETHPQGVRFGRSAMHTKNI